MLYSKLLLRHVLLLLLNTAVALAQQQNDESSISFTINGLDAPIASDVVEPSRPFAFSKPSHEDPNRPESSSFHSMQARDAPGLPDQQAALAIHNAERKTKSLPPLEWDYNLAYDALIYAQALAISGKYEFSYQGSRPGQEENVAWARCVFLYSFMVKAL